MHIFLLTALGLSALAISIAFWAEASAIRNDVRGANGFILFIFLLVSATASMGITLVVLIFDSFSLAWRVALASVLWHGVTGFLTILGLSAIGRNSNAKKDET